MTRSANAATSSSDLSVPAVTAAIDAGGGLLAAWTGAARTAKHNAPMIFDFTSRLRGNVFYVGKLASRADTHDESASPTLPPPPVPTPPTPPPVWNDTRTAPCKDRRGSDLLD